MRKWPRLSIAGMLICLVGLYPLLAPPAHHIDKDHFDLIQNGMTLAEIESIFGQPAGNYDWAEAESSNAWLFEWTLTTAAWDVAKNRSYAVVLTESNLDTAATAWIADGSKFATPRTVIWTEFAGQLHSAHNKGWTSRHGACTIGFDRRGLVAYKSSWGESRVVPPWQGWWKKIFGE